MSTFTRRRFLAAAATASLANSARSRAGALPSGAVGADARVDLTTGGIPLSAQEYAQLLERLTATGNPRDFYSRGGAVEALEQQFAGLLGKEVALFMPSGTLANHIAVRTLAGRRRRVVLQETSHLYNDSGDCAQQLSGLTLVPLAPGRASFTWEQVGAEIERASAGRVPTDVGAISIESPVRRLRHESFDFASMQRISAEARRSGIGMHFDGARVFLAAAYTDRSVTDYTALFDTVYVSLWKCFNSGNGAILAGPKTILEGMYNVRRMFGGALCHAWPDAVVASYFAEGYLGRIKTAVAIAEQAWAKLSSDDRFEIERVRNGTNTLRLVAKGVDANSYGARLSLLGVDLPEPEDGSFWIQVNETVRRLSASDLVAKFTAALRS